ncbi:MAG: hypothetical protein PWR20_988 [Bacteroidales bacterium]|jgi:hypothetical protein|nr:hypothetical protein [Bacteroidales bacterium]MDN5329961.1 hypothetical protein [Bacteroidales bacterium]NLH53267.1 DUF3127 domain-containing protein [Bacteroidales bacterium]NPV36894.1 DUF3127 domain-containing protein [Bacteroidales bacterium]
MDHTINGKLVKVLEPQSGTSARGNWKKQSFIIETIETYPKKICLIAWNERTEILKELTPGDELKISFSIESREYNERWYTDVRAYEITKVSGASAPIAPPTEQYYLSERPPIAQPDASPSNPAPIDDDLPF